VEKIKNPLAVRMINQPRYSEINFCVALKKSDEAERLLKTINVIEQIRRTDVINLDLFKLCIVSLYNSINSET
jgi:hypothetical protein